MSLIMGSISYKAMSTNGLLTKSDELLDKIAKLQLEASLLRCKQAVDRLLEGLGPDCTVSAHRDGPNCPCFGLELEDVDSLIWEVEYYDEYVDNSCIYNSFTFKYFSIRRLDGTSLNWDSLIDIDGYTVDAPESLPDDIADI